MSENDKQGYPYFYDEQIAKYLKQFGRIFNGLKVRYGVERDGEIEERKVPVIFAQVERNIANIINRRSPWTNQSFPVIAFTFDGIEVDRDSFVPSKHVESMVYTDKQTGDRKGVQSLVGPAFDITSVVHIVASSMDELFQILEQILLMFNDKLVIQKSDDLFDHNYITEVFLTGIADESSHPIGTDANSYHMSLNFEFKIRLNYPLQYPEVIKHVKASVFDNTNDPVDVDKIEESADEE